MRLFSTKKTITSSTIHKPKKTGKKILLVTGIMMALFMAAPVANNSTLNTMTGTMTTYAAETATFSQYWTQDSQGNWKVKDAQGNVMKNCWLCDDAVKTNGQEVWYLLDANGNMVSAGLVQDGTGNYYSLETNHNGYYGMLRHISGNYDGVNLDLESNHGGSYAKVKNQAGIDALKAKYGVTTVTIDNSNCVYTSSFSSSGSGGSSVSPSGGGAPSGGQQQQSNQNTPSSNSDGTFNMGDVVPITDPSSVKGGDGTGLGSLH